MQYQRISIGNLVNLKQGFAINKNTKHHMADEPTEIHLLRIGDMKENSFSVYVRDTIPDSFIVDENDIIYTRTGQVGLVFRNQKGVIHNNCFSVTPKDDSVLDRGYLYYALQSKDFYEEANSKASGAAQPDLSHSAFNSIMINLPVISTQRRISDVLQSYDDLITNNHKQIKLLEEVAQRLYKKWFVDLQFPGYEKKKIIDGIPEGWEKKTIDDICVKTKKIIAPNDIPKGTPYIGLEHIPRHDFCLSEWGDSSEISSSKAQYKKNDIIFGQIRPYFHKVGFALNDGVASTDSFIMTPQRNIWGLFLMTVFSDSFVNYSYQTCKEGAKMPRADWNQMKKYKVLVPDEETRIIFEQYVANITEKVCVLALQGRSLVEARNRLLPKLISGEVEL